MTEYAKAKEELSLILIEIEAEKISSPIDKNEEIQKRLSKNYNDVTVL